MKEGNKEKIVNVRFPEDVYERLKAQADDMSIPFSVFVRMAVLEYAKKREKEDN